MVFVNITLTRVAMAVKKLIGHYYFDIKSFL